MISSFLLYRRFLLSAVTVAVLSLSLTNTATAAGLTKSLPAVKVKTGRTPFALVTFSTVEKNNQMISTWTVTNEENVRAYELEGSEDGSTFRTMRSIIAKKAGTYSIVNRRPSNQFDYYRLKMIDVDGGLSYSAVVSTKIEESITTYELVIAKEFVSQPGMITIVNAQGVIVLEKESTYLNKVEKIDIRQLTAGIYSVNVVVGIKTETKSLEIKK